MRAYQVCPPSHARSNSQTISCLALVTKDVEIFSFQAIRDKIAPMTGPNVKRPHWETKSPDKEGRKDELIQNKKQYIKGFALAKAKNRVSIV